MLTVKFVMLFDFEGLRPFSHKLFLLSLFPLTVGVLFAIVSAFRRGSRAALFLLIAATPLTASGMVELLMEMSAVPENLPLEEFFIFSMVVLVLGTFIAVGDRFVVLRVERDRANMRAIKMQRMAHSDALTGVSNRRAFDALGSIPDGKALLIADIDHFKAINDERGHPVGDAVIAQVATRLRHALPKDCETMIYRLGGEEFALVVTARDRSALECAAETMRRTVASGERRRADDLPAVTISVGGALGKGRPLREVYADADGALYRAKQAGRNRIAICGDG
jgi:diguanylate cyclase (GGDEF)-like protein